MQKQGPHTGKLKVQEGRKRLEEESGEMQVELVELQVCLSSGVLGEEWGTRCCRGGEEGEQTGRGILQ